MLTRKLNYLYEKSLILLVCAWGNWALYYLVAVLVFDASFLQLKAFSWIFLACLLGSVFYLRKVGFPVGAPEVAVAGQFERLLVAPVGARFWLLLGVVVALALVAVVLVTRLGLSQTLPVYNLAWVVLLPFFLLVSFRYARPHRPGVPVTRVPLASLQQVDSLLPLLCMAFLAIGLFGRGFPSPDDAYYAHILSSLVAAPSVPVLGADTLLGTEAPYVIHPAYRPVGYEVLVAAVGDLLGVKPESLFYRWMSVPNAILWVLALQVFMRALRVPLPGVAVGTCVVVYSLWTYGFAPGNNLIFAFWGKSLLLLAAAPLLFALVSAHIESPGWPSWILLLLAVAATVTWSSSSLFLTPAAVGLGAAVFVRSILGDIKRLVVIACSLAPLFAALAYSVWVLSWAPITGDSLNPGILRVHGEAFGEIDTQIVVLFALPALLLLSRTVIDPVFQRLIYRLCVIGFFTVLTPYLLELLSLLLGTNFLARRLQYAYPSGLVFGILASIALLHVMSWRASVRRFHLQATAAIAIVFAFFFTSIRPYYLFGDWWDEVDVYRQDYREAQAARALIPDGAFVAAGDIDDLLPLLPDPPAFTSVRHYLGYYRGFMSMQEFRKRRELFVLLSLRSPRKNEEISKAVERLARIAKELAVTTLVYQPPGARHRLPVQSVFFYRRHVLDARGQEAFTEQLTRHLDNTGFDCRQTPSRKTWVCNREGAGGDASWR